MNYTVCAQYENGVAILDHKGRSEWKLRTAKRHAKDFAAAHGRQCFVIEASEPVHSAKIVYQTPTD